jgi:hypothetical protein
MPTTHTLIAPENLSKDQGRLRALELLTLFRRLSASELVTGIACIVETLEPPLEEARGSFSQLSRNIRL